MGIENWELADSAARSATMQEALPAIGERVFVPARLFPTFAATRTARGMGWLATIVALASTSIVVLADGEGRTAEVPIGSAHRLEVLQPSTTSRLMGAFLLALPAGRRECATLWARSFVNGAAALEDAGGGNAALLTLQSVSQDQLDRGLILADGGCLSSSIIFAMLQAYGVDPITGSHTILFLDAVVDACPSNDWWYGLPDQKKDARMCAAALLAATAAVAPGVNILGVAAFGCAAENTYSKRWLNTQRLGMLAVATHPGSPSLGRHGRAMCVVSFLSVAVACALIASAFDGDEELPTVAEALDLFWDLLPTMCGRMPREALLAPRDDVAAAAATLGESWVDLTPHQARDAAGRCVPLWCDDEPCSTYCEHSRRRDQCKECDGPNICEHGRLRRNCKECGGGSICTHGKLRTRCKECGGGSLCTHGRVRSQCKECGGGDICTHGRMRTRCKECGGGSICTHGRVRTRCKECGGGSVCEHGRRRGICKECGGGSMCTHGRLRSKCKECGGVVTVCKNGRKCCWPSRRCLACRT